MFITKFNTRDDAKDYVSIAISTRDVAPVDFEVDKIVDEVFAFDPVRSRYSLNVDVDEFWESVEKNERA